MEEETPILFILGWIPQRTSYGYGYGSLQSPAVLILRLAEPSPFALSSLVGTSGSDGALVIIVQNIRRGGRLRHQVVVLGVAKSVPDLYNLLRLGLGRAQSAIVATPQQWLRSSGGHASE